MTEREKPTTPEIDQEHELNKTARLKAMTSAILNDIREMGATVRKSIQTTEEITANAANIQATSKAICDSLDRIAEQDRRNTNHQGTSQGSAHIGPKPGFKNGRHDIYWYTPSLIEG